MKRLTVSFNVIWDTKHRSDLKNNKIINNLNKSIFSLIWTKRRVIFEHLMKKQIIFISVGSVQCDFLKVAENLAIAHIAEWLQRP